MVGSTDPEADGPTAVNGFAFEGTDAGGLDYALNRAIGGGGVGAGGLAASGAKLGWGGIVRGAGKGCRCVVERRGALLGRVGWWVSSQGVKRGEWLGSLQAVKPGQTEPR